MFSNDNLVEIFHPLVVSVNYTFYKLLTNNANKNLLLYNFYFINNFETAVSKYVYLNKVLNFTFVKRKLYLKNFAIQSFFNFLRFFLMFLTKLLNERDNNFFNERVFFFNLLFLNLKNKVHSYSAVDNT